MTYIYQSDANSDIPEEGVSRLLEELQSGDCMVVQRFSAAADSSRSLLVLLSELEERGIRFRSLEEDFDTGSEKGRFAQGILRSAARLDAAGRREKPGTAAREDGRTKGRKPIEVDEEMFDAIVEQWQNGEITAREAMNILNLKPNTFYRRVKERSPDTKSSESLLDAALKLGKDIVNTVQGGSQAAGKAASEIDLEAFSETVKKNITAVGTIVGQKLDELSKDLQDAALKHEPKTPGEDVVDAGFTPVSEEPEPPAEPAEVPEDAQAETEEL